MEREPNMEGRWKGGKQTESEVNRNRNRNRGAHIPLGDTGWHQDLGKAGTKFYCLNTVELCYLHKMEKD